MYSVCNAYTVRGHFVTTLHSRNTWERSFTRESTQRTKPMTNSMWSTTWSLVRVGRRFSQRTTEKSSTKMTSKPSYWISVFFVFHQLLHRNTTSRPTVYYSYFYILAVSSFSHRRDIYYIISLSLSTVTGMVGKRPSWCQLSASSANSLQQTPVLWYSTWRYKSKSNSQAISFDLKCTTKKLYTSWWS